MELIFATNNEHKVEEVLQAMAGDVRILTLKQCGLSGDIPETAPTLEGNATQKARWVYERTDGSVDVFADDTGLEIEALGGEPGVYSARYSGGDAEANMALVLSKMEGVENREAQFRTVICLKRAGGDEYFFEGIVRGRILEERQGSEGFGYDPIFEPEGFGISFAQMSLDDKNRISHRGRAVSALNTFLATRL